jgi:hypothetical protein
MKIFPILLLVCLCDNLIAQVKLTASHLFEFKGVVQDSIVNEIIPSANISFYQNNQIVRRTITNNNGEFEVWLPKGNYTYTVSCVGFNTKKGTTDSTLQNNRGFEIKLSEATNTTSEVVIKTKKNNIGSIYCGLTRSTSGCSFTYKPYQWLVINPSNYMRGPFLVPPKEKK